MSVARLATLTLGLWALAACKPVGSGEAHPGSPAEAKAPAALVAANPAAAGPATPGRHLDLPPVKRPENWGLISSQDTPTGRYTAAWPVVVSAKGCEAGPKLEGRLYWQAIAQPRGTPASLAFDEVWPPEVQMAAFEPAETSGAAPKIFARVLPHTETGLGTVEVQVRLTYGTDDDLREVTLLALLPAEQAPGDGPLKVIWRGVGEASHDRLGVCRTGHEASWARDAAGRPGLKRSGYAEILDSAEEENSQTPALGVARRTCKPPADIWVHLISQP